MMNNCPICGRRHCIHWPQFWPYRRGPTYYCSDSCMDVDIVKDIQLLQEVKRKRSAKKMTRMKKDGTPAKKPGPKKKIETPESNMTRVASKAPETPEQVPAVKLTGPIRIETPEPEKVQVETPEKADYELKKPLNKIVGPCHIDKFLITAIKHPDLGEFYYDKKFKAVDWRTPEGDEVSMNPSAWNSLLNELPHILRILGAR